jgi:EAL domain-containing protein (putative c-di-GMP-specific phosphodiesterase class I)
MGKSLQPVNAIAVRQPANNPPAAGPAVPTPAPHDPVTAESLGWQLRAALPPMRLHSVSLWDDQTNTLWLSEGALGPDEHNVVVEALEALGKDSSVNCYESGLEDGRIALFLPVRSPQGALVALAMVLADIKSVNDSVLEKLVTPQIRTILQKVAVLLRPAQSRSTSGESTAKVLTLAPDLPAAAPNAAAPTPRAAISTARAAAPTARGAASIASAPSSTASAAAAAPGALSAQAIDDILEFELTPDVAKPVTVPAPSAPAASRAPKGVGSSVASSSIASATPTAISVPVVNGAPTSTEIAAMTTAPIAPTLTAPAATAAAPIASAPQASASTAPTLKALARSALASKAATPTTALASIAPVTSFDDDLRLPSLDAASAAPANSAHAAPDVSSANAQAAKVGALAQPSTKVALAAATIPTVPTLVATSPGAPTSSTRASASAPTPMSFDDEHGADPTGGFKAIKPNASEPTASATPTATASASPTAAASPSASAVTWPNPAASTSPNATASPSASPAAAPNTLAPTTPSATSTSKALAPSATGTSTALGNAAPDASKGAGATSTSRVLAMPDGVSLILEVQPFSKLRTGGRMRRYEVLARSSHPNRTPAGVDKIALQQLLTWMSSNRATWSLEPTSFTLNLSISTLEDDRFPQFVASNLKTHGIAPDNIGFEIAEPLCLQRRAQVERFMSLCDKLGCFVVIDDFSLDSQIVSLLRSKALRLVKIDPRLTSVAMKDKLSQAMVVAITQAVKVLGIHCAAKRVDSQASMQWLTGIGCDFAQGTALANLQTLESLASAPAPTAA